MCIFLQVKNVHLLFSYLEPVKHCTSRSWVTSKTPADMSVYLSARTLYGQATRTHTDKKRQ